MRKNKKVLWIYLGILVIIFFISGCSEQYEQNKTKITNVDDSCETDLDCKDLYCENKEGPLLVGPIEGICEYNKCVCGCGDPENESYCD